MPSLEQLPEAAIVQATDLVLLDQNGTAKSASVEVLQAHLQPLLNLAPNVLLGRASPLPGQPEPIAVGNGVLLSAGVLSADTTILAPVLSANLTGTPTAPTPPSGDSSNRIATTAFVQTKLTAPMTLAGDITGTGPASNGVLTATLPAIISPGTFSSVSVNQKGQVTAGTVLPNGTSVELQSNKGAIGGYAGLDSTGKVPLAQLPSTFGAVSSVAGRTGAVTLSVADVAGAAPLASPSFSGVPSGTTAAATDNSTALATTAFVKSQGYITSSTAPVSSVAGRTGLIALAVSDVSGAAPVASPILTGSPTAPTPAPTDNSNAIATTSFVKGQGYITAASAPVSSVAGRTGAITLVVADVSGAVSSVSPAFSGTPTAPTASPSDNSTTVATTAFVKSQGYVTASTAPVTSVAGRTGSIALAVSDVSGAASTASPALTGTPTAPTAPVNTNSAQLATTAFVLGQAANVAPVGDGVAAIGNSSQFARQDHVHPTDASRAPLASPALTGTPTAPTPASTDNSNTIATTSFVKGQGYITASGAPVSSVAGRTGAIVLGVTDVSGAVSSASPAFSGIPTAPTASINSSTTQLATTAFVLGQVANVAPLADGTAAVGSSSQFARQDHVHPTDVSRAPLASPALAGTPTAPTPVSTDNSNAIATTSFVKGQGYITAAGAPVSSVAGRTGAIMLGVADVGGAAPTGSPAFSGIPTAPTAPVNTNTTQLATTGFVIGQAANVAPLVDGTAAVGVSTQFSRQDHVHPTDSSRAPLASPVFTGTPTAPTVASSDNSTAVSTTAFVKSQGYVTASTAPVISVAGQTGVVTDLSAGTTKATGSITSRSLASRFAERFDVLDYGADPTGTTDFSSNFQSLASSITSGGTIYFPQGTYLFSSNTYVPDNVNVMLDAGAKFSGSGGVNAVADGTVITAKQANFVNLSVSSTDANAWGTHSSFVIASTSGSANYEKGAGYDATVSYDSSSYSVGTGGDTALSAKDAVGRQMSATIVGTTLGRAWGSVSGTTALGSADGLLIGHEIDLTAQVSQGENNRKNTKSGSMVVSTGPGQPTNGYLVTATGAAWYDGYTALKSAVSRYAFVLRDLSTYPSTVVFGVDASGNVTGQKISGTLNTLDDGSGNATIHGFASLAGGLADASYVNQTPSNGFTITVPNGCSTLQLTPATALSSGSITMPSAPSNGQWLLVASTLPISSLSFVPASGQSILNPPLSLPVGVEVAFQYQSASSRWVCQSGNDQRVANAASAGSLLFGTGADGSVTISSGTTTLTRDIHYANLTISGTGAINTNGWRMFVYGTLDLSAAAPGAIVANGANGVTAAGSTGAFGPGGIAMRTVGVSPTTGGTGGSGSSGTGGTGSAGGSSTYGNGGNGGSGGNGGNSSGAGGSAGSGGTQSVQMPLNTPTITFYTTASTSGLAAGLLGGGGGGGGGDGTNAGGGGGSGGSFGGTIALFARVIQRGNNTNSSLIQAKGGIGGNGASATSGNAAGGGGGGGGGGGLIYLINETLLGNTLANALDVSGGNGGPGGSGSGTGKGGVGGNGGASGSVQVLNLLTPSYTVSTWNVSGSAGGSTSIATGGTAGAGAVLKLSL